MTGLLSLAAVALGGGAGWCLPRVSPLRRLAPDDQGSVTVRRCVAAARSAAVWLRRRTRRRRHEDAVRAAVVETCGALAAALRAGSSPDAALARAADEVALVGERLRPVVASVRLGGDVGEAWSRAAGVPGADGLRALGAAFQVASESGASLAHVVERVAVGLRAQEEHRRAVAAHLAGPRATARLLAGLPAFGLLLGTALGARPLQVLLGTSVGLVCLVSGIALAALGVGWVGVLTRRAESAA